VTGRARLLGTGLPPGAVSSTRSVALEEGWLVASTPPGAWANPEDLDPGSSWRPATVPGTVAVSVGPQDVDAHPDYDALDWWYRCELPSHASAGTRRHLRFDGLATLAEVWLNGEKVLESDDMFCAYEVDVTDIDAGGGTLAICFRSVGRALEERRPRPRWKTKLVERQQLRWIRTTLLGRIPGWTPPIAAVGPWRGVWAEAVDLVHLESLDLRTGMDGEDGLVHVRLAAGAAQPGVELTGAALRLGDQRHGLAVEAGDGGWTVHGTPRVERPARWWPRTHGEPILHECAIEIETSLGAVVVDCGRVGFRELEVDRSDGRIRFVVNGTPIFCRGSCWTTNDIVSLVGDPTRMRASLELLAEAHGNMIRVGGTMVYESDDFYRACDELGLMVWQDFMFANMDYPSDDEDFARTVRGEATQQVRRLARHPSVVAFCGGSETEQQAAMFGAPREAWTNDFFSKTLPSLVEEAAPGTAYWSSTPTGGALPFHVDEGLAHYYGVGAYRRPLEDVRVASVKFSPECLGFSHVPEDVNLRKLTPSGAVPPHHPAWKRGVPRDTGPGWDFEDIRDHYLERLYGVDPVRLRSDDLERYMELSRVVTGEAMAHAFAEWRRDEDPCAGALTWFWNDLRAGAGWGVVDSDRMPKAAYHHLRRAWAPQCVRLLDRGLGGLMASVVNEHEEPFEGRLELLAVSRGGRIAAEACESVCIPGRSSCETAVEAAFDHFMDSTYSYRFGPPRHEAIVGRLVSTEEDLVVSEDVYRPVRAAMTPASSLEAKLELVEGGRLALTLSSDRLLYDVRIEVRDYSAQENHFCLAPGRAREIRLRRVFDSGKPPRGYVDALNLVDVVPLASPGQG